MARLRIQTPGRAAWEVDLDGREFRLGRGEDCEIVIDEHDISRQHAVLRAESRGGFAIEDLGSRNGVWVNDERVTRQSLSPGDVLRLGRNVQIELIDDEDAEEEEEEAPRRAAQGGGRAFSPLGWLKDERWALRTGTGRRARLVPLKGSSVIVGREASAGVSVDDESVSKMHARIDRDRGGLIVTDLKSRNGTLVNDDAVLQSPLEPGDTVQFGDIAFEVVHEEHWAFHRLGLVALVLVGLVALAFGAKLLSDRLSENAAMQETRERIHREALSSVRQGIEAWERGDADFARGYLTYAADVLQMSGLAPAGATLEKPAELFRNILRELPADQRQFDFDAALDPANAATARARLDQLPNKDYVDHETRRLAIELGQDAGVPDGFVTEVWYWVDGFSRRDRGTFQTWLNRSREIQPELRRVLAEAHLPEVFCYVSWIESGLNPRAQSPVGAVGLWQLMIPTARQYGLRIDPASGLDERTDVTRSTTAASKYIANLLRKFGPEQFMCALASYNRGEGGVWHSMEQIPDPMMPSSKKYWYLVQHNLIPDETSKYVPKIFAAAILAGNPERFGFQRP